MKKANVNIEKVEVPVKPDKPVKKKFSIKKTK